MQTSVPELMDISEEPKAVLEMYGAEPGKASFANNCLLARRLAERGVRFVQLYHRDWDHHGNLPKRHEAPSASETDQASAALVTRPEAARPAGRYAGHLGRRVRPDRLLPGQADAGATSAATTTRAASRSGWPAAASRAGITYGKTDDFGYNIVEDGVHVHDFQATLLHLLGIDHTG